MPQIPTCFLPRYVLVVSPYGLPCPISVRTRRPPRSTLPTCRRAGNEPPPLAGRTIRPLSLGRHNEYAGSPAVGYAYICERPMARR